METENHSAQEKITLKKTSVNGLPEEENLLSFNVQQQDSDLDEDTRCGFGPCSPSWLQPLASKKVFVLNIGLVGMIIVAIASYFVGTISTMEKRFKIPSKTSGMISSMWDVGAIIPLMAFSYIGGRGHRTRWLAVGSIVVAISCFLRALVHSIYGAGEDALALTLEHGSGNVSSSTDQVEDQATSGLSLCGTTPQKEKCDSGANMTVGATWILLVAHVILGIGASTYHTLGLSYMDDNSRKDKSPIYMAVSQVLRMLGPTVGFMTASYTLSQYIDPSLTPSINTEDPRWIGAWWMGWIPFGIAITILGVCLSLFPRRLPKSALHKPKPKKTANNKRSFTDFLKVFRRVLGNPVLVFNTMSAVAFSGSGYGYWTFMPKYMETQFRKSASEANFFSGAMGLIFMALGVLSSAVVISRFKPRARVLAGWNVFTEVVDLLTNLTWAFIACPIDDMNGSWREDGTWEMKMDCNMNCSCPPHIKYSPVCADDGSGTFYSACHAGCKVANFLNGTMSYSNCSCIGGGNGGAVEGPCPIDCSYGFTLYIALQCLCRFLGATGKSGNTLLSLRSVDEADKPVAIGFSEMLMALLGYIPGPIVFGYLLDYACIVWGESCGHTGNCWLYNGHSMRYLLNFTAAGCIAFGILMDIGVWYNSKGLKIYDEDDKKKDEDQSERILGATEKVQVSLRRNSEHGPL